MTSTTPVSPPVKGAALTSYVILWCAPEGDNVPEGDTASIWRADPTVIKAPNGDAAIRQWADKRSVTDGTSMVAVPARSWQPRKVKVETSTKVTLG